jgi:protocatechuate 3,4-dioxygenase beta subunit
VPIVIWKQRKDRRIKKRSKKRSGVESVKRRTRGPERLEARRLFAADPIHVGVVYLETDYLETDQDVGGDSRGDRFILSFTGGASDTELTEVRITTDKDGDGISVGDPIYDTAIGGRGKDIAHGFQVVRTIDADGQTINVSAEVDDGGQELVLRLTNFHAGDRLEFSIDVDEVLRNAIDLEVFNDRLDVITSGQEFQDSILEATFNAPHYETSHADAIFLNDYGNPANSYGLDLPPDESDDVDSRPNRSAAAVATTVQTAKPIEISGHVWIDNNLDAVLQTGEELLSGVEIALWKQSNSGSYLDTGLRSTTDGNGQYRFPKSLGLRPGTYRIVESQPVDLYSVAAVAGTVSRVSSGRAESMDVLTDVAIPLGDSSAINYDFAEARPASIAGFVYQDDNNDGIKDPDETGIAGVRIQLVPINTLAPQSTLTVTTGGDGSYAFTGLAPGSYEVIEVDQPALLNDGLDAAGTVNGQTVGSAQNPGDRIVGIALTSGDDGIDYNFGEVPLGSISGYVYLAAPGQDCTGHQDDGGSTLLSGVEVELQSELGITIARTTTGVDGAYSFDEVPVGNYRIVEFTPDELIDGSSHVGRIDNVRVGTSVNGGLVQDIVMTAGGVGVEYNFCEGTPASISGYVYHDQSQDGVRDAVEDPIKQVQVALIDESGSIVATTLTDSQGAYRFDGLTPGQYSIIETQPVGYIDGIDSVGNVRGQSRGQLGDNDQITSINLKQGDEGVEFNFGEIVPAALFGRVHIDVDGDCILGENEETLAGVTIRLIDAGGNEVARTVTDTSGEYSFENLPPGEYSIVEEQPAGFFEGGAKAGTAGGDVVNGSQITSIVLSSGETALNYDFCERPPAEIVGSVFSDRNGDCHFDANEVGIDGVRVELYDSAGNLIASTNTDSSGNYRFTNLPAGEYTIRELQPAGWLQGGQSAGSHGGDDSQQDVIRRVPVGWGQRLTQYNFCELQPSSISGTVFVDGNGDCLRQDDEPPIDGVTIELRDMNGQFVARTTTDANGQYQFGDLEPGDYQIFEVQPDGFFQGGQTPGSGLGEVLGQDLLGFRVGAGEHLVNYNFCEIPPASISGFVHVDDDGDCEFDPDERPVEGVKIELRDSSGRVVSVTNTDANGQYRFDNLAPGEYQIFEYQPDGLFQGGQRVGTGDGIVLATDLLGVNLSAGQTVENYNFCEIPPASIGGMVWQESDPNGNFDPGDVPIPGVLVDLIDDSGTVIQQQRTDTGGKYRFTALRPGVYAVREHQPEGLFHGGEFIGDLGGDVGGDDLLVGITLAAGTDGNDYNFPEVPPAVLTGFVFQDGAAILTSETIDPADLRQFRDGQLTPDDTRLSGVTLELRNILGLPFDASRALPGTYANGPIRTATDEFGYYEFTGLRPGTYHVYQVQPENFIDGLDTPGTTGGVAVNPADTVSEDDQITIQTLVLSELTDPHDDAILNITLAGGGRSDNNNFSEVVIDDPQVPPPSPPVQREDPPLVDIPIEEFETQIRSVTYAEPRVVRNPVVIIDEWAVSWHLSLINGGFPRGTVGEHGVIHSVSSKRMAGQWKEGDHSSGRWSIVGRDVCRTEIDSDVDAEITLGDENATALAGDFDGDGRDEAVIFVGGQWFVDLNGNGQWDAGDLWMQLGTELDRPVVGDWDGDGKDDIGIFGRQWLRDPYRIKRDPGLPDPENRRRREFVSRTFVARDDEGRGEDRTRLLKRGDEGSLRSDAVDHVFKYGDQPDTPVAGDWNGDGIDQIGIFRQGIWLVDSDGDGRWTESDKRAEFGRPGDQPIVGDFNGDQIDEIGVVRGDQWIIDTDGDRKITGNDLEINVPRESKDSQPVVGDWDGDGKDEPGYYDEAA